MVLTKSGFLDYRRCAKSFWVRTHRPDEVEQPAPDPFALMLMRQGYEVEDLVRDLVAAWADADQCRFQVTFQATGLKARSDLVRHNPDGSLDIFEVKSSTSTKDHIDDATFQTLVMERAGETVRSINIVHLNKEYVRAGDIDPAALLIFADVSEQVRDRLPLLCPEIDQALAFLAEPTLDENGCSCLFVGNPADHCSTFSRFNPGVVPPSLYILPRISKSKLEKFHSEDRFELSAIAPTELTARQALVLRAAVENQPVINKEKIASFLDDLKWPLHFYDYETFGSAIPIADGHRPHEQMPVQFSLHRLDQKGVITHFEYLADRPGMQHDLVDALEAVIDLDGSVISWNMSFENACNKRMARLLPAKAPFLANVNERTRDLMVPFEDDYVDARFGGSTSIKEVLPVLVPHLAYSTTEVHDGTGAMEAWLKLTKSDDEAERADLRRQLLAYCALDSIAMVEIMAVLRAAAS